MTIKIPFLATLIASALLTGTAGAETLISAQEAALPPAGQGLALRSISRGPRAELESPGPQDGAVKSPLDFKIGFHAFGGTTIDLASVRVTYLKKPAVDLTPRLKKYLKPTGLEMPVAEIPPGEHEIRIDLKDSDGHPGTSILKIKVSP
jgi:hypothetical protein